MKCTINYPCPSCKSDLTTEFPPVESKIAEVFKCPQCGKTYFLHFELKTYKVIDDPNSIYSADEARRFCNNRVKERRLLNEIIKLYQKETNYIILDLKKTFPKNNSGWGPIAELESCIMKKGKLSDETISDFEAAGYTFKITSDVDTYRLEISW